jgi:hypothetical protein
MYRIVQGWPNYYYILWRAHTLSSSFYILWRAHILSSSLYMLWRAHILSSSLYVLWRAHIVKLLIVHFMKSTYREAPLLYILWRAHILSSSFYILWRARIVKLLIVHVAILILFSSSYETKTIKQKGRCECHMRSNAQRNTSAHTFLLTQGTSRANNGIVEMCGASHMNDNRQMSVAMQSQWKREDVKPF